MDSDPGVVSDTQTDLEIEAGLTGAVKRVRKVTLALHAPKKPKISGDNENQPFGEHFVDLNRTRTTYLPIRDCLLCSLPLWSLSAPFCLV